MLAAVDDHLWQSTLIVILAWLVLAVALRMVAPRWDDVTHDGDFEHLPAEMTSVRGTELLHRAFPGTRAKSQLVVVVARTEAHLEPSDLTVVEQIAEAFQAQRTSGAMISANAVRARLSRDFTVPRFTPVISAISS